MTEAQIKSKVDDILFDLLYDTHKTVDQAAASIMELVDKEKIEFAEWFCKEYNIRGDYSEHTLISSLHSDIHRFSQSKTAKNDD